MMILLILQLIVAPDHRLTPGLIRTNISAVESCATRWSLDARHVTTRMRRQVFQSYGIAWSDRRFYVVDHLIPRELGGADDLRNLWPQSKANAKRKDVWENRLHRDVCAGRMRFVDAQRIMRNWDRP